MPHRQEENVGVGPLVQGDFRATGSPFSNGLIEQQDLVLIGRLKDRLPLLKVRSRDRRGCPLARGIATFGSIDQLLQGRIEVVQFDSYSQSSRSESFLIPFDSRPVAPLQNHAAPIGEEILGENPQLMFDAHSKLLIPYIGTKLSRPLVLVQPDGGDFGCELTSERRLARGWKPTDQHEPRR